MDATDFTRADDNALDLIFNTARTFDEFRNIPVPENLLKSAYELARMAPTSANCQPMRLLFLQSQVSRARLAPALSSTNREKTLRAPVTAIIAYDLDFPATLPDLYRIPNAEQWFSNDPLIKETAFRNGSLQGAYFMLAARAIGLDVGPMSGFDNALVDQEFFSAPPYDTWESNFLCNLGFGNSKNLPPRDPRPEFANTCAII